MKNVLKRAVLALLLVCGIAAGGVANAQMGGVKEQPKAKEDVKEDGSKLPWSQDEIQKSIKKGGSMKFKLEQDANGTKQTMFVLVEITEVSDKGFKSKTTYTDKDGKAVDGMEAEEEDKEWGEMYAEFLTSETKVSSEKVKVGGKEVECKLYHTSVDNGGVKSSMKVWFIKDKPGYLAKMEAVAEGEGVKQTTVLTLEEMK